ncbi:DUF7144 family membrane protein [Amycolatopsis decaplanina]|uniref:Integral membrane protein n=1 Tax=Amycolatopsis decaplanina DSM 44594 TaxID=1284240 RepID=M2YXC4_9PSEU|nr:hypothetical protein [Amycolatopsis decaplanina]EME52999.1 integral membrane protein [Amycolatopsis decaplanina DSM 44594]
MSERAHHWTTAPGTGPPSPPDTAASRSRRSGWIWFAGSITIMAGLFTAVEGLVALFDRNYYLLGPSGLLVFDLGAWGWVHLIVGALAVFAGGALFTGAPWARIVTAVLAGFNALAQMVFLSAYPIWGVVVIALDVLVIWAVLVHGDEAPEELW